MDMKTAVSLPDPVFRSAERLAERLGISRSELYCRALRELLQRNDPDQITALLNDVYSDPSENPGVEPGLAELQNRSIADRQRR
jgi:metal-responsive CopG/Arc/MetJ family transcriptional regulator